MKTVAKVFIILSMVSLFWSIIPVIVGIFALKALNENRKKDDIIGISIVTLIFCSFIGGILMLCMSDEQLAE